MENTALDLVELRPTYPLEQKVENRGVLIRNYILKSYPAEIWLNGTAFFSPISPPEAKATDIDKYKVEVATQDGPHMRINSMDVVSKQLECRTGENGDPASAGRIVQGLAIIVINQVISHDSVP